MKTALPALLLAAALALPTPALACSPASGYRIPTNLELAGEAEAVFIGQVIGGTPMNAAAFATASIQVRPVAMLKGELPGDPITLRGFALAEERYAGLSNPYELTEAHPVTYVGACIRTVFPLGTRALFFLRRQGGQWGPAGGPFSRWAEDTLDPQGPWPVLTALYLRAAALAPAERNALLEAERDRLLAIGDDPVARLMAADITRQLAGPNPPLRGELPDEDDSGDDAANDAPNDAGDAEP